MAQATIKSLTGKAFAVSADGKSFREVQVGDVLQQGEVLRPAAGARVELALPDGKTLAVAEGQAIKIDDTLAQTPQTPTAQEGAVAGGAINNVIAALERGGDLTQELEATAAGLGGGGGGDGSGFVRLLRIAEPVDPLAYDYEPSLNEIPQFERGIGETVVAEDTPTPESRTVEAALEQESGHRGAYSSGASGAGWYISGYSGGRGTDEDDGGSSLKTGNLLKGEGESLTTITVAGRTFTFSAEKPFVFLQFDKDGHLIVESSFSPESTGPYTPPAVQLVINQNGSYTMAVVGYVEHGTQTSTEDGEITDLGKAVEEFLNLDTVTATGTTNGQPMTITFQPKVQDDVPVAIDDVARVDDGYADGNVIGSSRRDEYFVRAIPNDDSDSEQPQVKTGAGQDLLSADGGNTVTHVDGVKLDFTEESYQVQTLAPTQMFGAPGAPMFMPAYPSGAWSQWVEGEHGRIRFKANGQYEYQHERIYSEGDNETREYVAAPGSFTVSAYDLGESIFDANGNFQAGTKAAGSYEGSDGNDYYGVNTPADDGLEAQPQVNYAGSLSQALAFTLAAGTQATSATVTVANLYQNENGGEAARWHAFDANGVRIASGVISNNADGAVYGSTTSVTWTTGADNKNVGTFTVNTEAPFTTLVIEALPYSNNGSEEGDSSDFFATVNSFNTVPTVEEFTDVFTYTLTDRDGDSSTATLTISGGQPVVVGELSNVAPNAEDNTYVVASVGADAAIKGNIITDDQNGGGAASGRDWDQDTPVLNLSVYSINVADEEYVLQTGVNTFTLPNGELKIETNGAFTYTPNAGATGEDKFTYVLQDVHGAQSESALVTFDLPELSLSAWNDNSNNGSLNDDDNKAKVFEVTQERIENLATGQVWLGALLKESKALTPEQALANEPKDLTLKITSDVTFTFLSEGAGYKNTVGWYDVSNPRVGHVVWANASESGSGGDLSADSTFTVKDMPAGTKLGFFLIPDAYKEGMPDTVYFEDGKVFSDAEHTTLINSAGNGDQEGAVWFSNSENIDGLQHAVTGLAEGESASKLYVGFEDLVGGGDKDYNDVVFTVDLGAGNEVHYDPVVFDLGVDIGYDGVLGAATVAFTLGDEDTVSYDTALAAARGLDVTTSDDGQTFVIKSTDDNPNRALDYNDLLDTFKIEVGHTGDNGDYTKVDATERKADVTITDTAGHSTDAVTAYFDLTVKLPEIKPGNDVV